MFANLTQEVVSNLYRWRRAKKDAYTASPTAMYRMWCLYYNYDPITTTAFDDFIEWLKTCSWDEKVDMELMAFGQVGGLYASTSLIPFAQNHISKYDPNSNSLIDEANFDCEADMMFAIQFCEPFQLAL